MPRALAAVGPDPLIDLCEFIFDGRRGLVMTLAGFFDESERRDGTEPISLAGYIFKPTAYKQFCRAWRVMLRSGPTPTTHFHMTDLYARQGEYLDWSPEARAATLRGAIRAVTDHMHCGVSVAFSQAEFERVAPSLWRVEYGSIYSAACQLVLKFTGHWMKKHKNFTPIAYAFESGHRFWDEADALLRGYGADKPLRLECRYKTHFPLDKKESCGLQAADMLSWLTTRGIVGFPDNRTIRAFAPVLEEFAVDARSRSVDRYEMYHPVGEQLAAYFAEVARTRDKHHIVRTAKKRKLLLR